MIIRWIRLFRDNILNPSLTSNITMTSYLKDIEKITMINETRKALCQYNKENLKHVICD